MYAELNSSIRLEDIIRGVIVQSGNDACIAIAEGIAGSEAAFGEMMTQRARELGLMRSRFTNATGLPDPDHLSTVRELAVLALHQIRDLGEYYHYYSETEFTWNNIKQSNRNPLLYQNIGADGLKTGYISAAGYGLVASAVRSNKRLILVLNGLESAKDRANEARKLLDWGFRNFRPYTMFIYGQVISEARVWGGTQNWVDLTANSEVRVMLSARDRENVRAQLVYEGPLHAPIAKGDEVARLRFVSDDNLTVAEFPLYSNEDVPESGVIDKALDTLMIMVLGG
jgi:D-alanyl-D-alanine carboxypeptidase (penicillin-binding protein 5/6)